MITSSQGNKYIFILYHYDTNSIHMVPIKSRYTQHIIQAWNKIFITLKKYSDAPNIYILDNKCSHEMKATFDAAYVKYQLLPLVYTGTSAIQDI